MVNNMAEAESYGIEAVRYWHAQGEVITPARAREIVEPFVSRGAECNRKTGTMVEMKRISSLILNLGRQGPSILDGGSW